MIDHCDNDGVSPLVCASQEGHLDVAQFLFSKNANVHHQNKDGVTPLMVASLAGQLEMVKLLLDRDAIIDHCDKGGVSPLLCASQEGHLEVAQFLLSKNANVHHRNKDGVTPLILASFGGHLEMVKLLLEHDALIDQCEDSGMSPLWCASHGGHLEVAQFLFSKNANVHHQNKDGVTPLIAASFAGHLEMVKLLLEHGARIDDHDNLGTTSIVHARNAGHSDIVRVLFDHRDTMNLEDQSLDLDNYRRDGEANEKSDSAFFGFTQVAQKQEGCCSASGDMEIDIVGNSGKGGGQRGDVSLQEILQGCENAGKKMRRPKPSEAERDYVELTKEDVVCERGTYGNRHLGNTVYLKHVDAILLKLKEEQKDYSSLLKKEKSMLCDEIVKWVRDRGGRFVMRDKVQCEDGKYPAFGPWYKATEQTAREKSSAALSSRYRKLSEGAN
jgi:ankyrin repeat protein